MKKIIEKIANLTTKDFLRYSISFFITGVVFLLIHILFNLDTNSSTLEIISIVFMSFAILSFPYISREHKDNLGIYFLKFLGYIFLIIITLGCIIDLIATSQAGNVNPISGIISALLLFITLNITVKPIIAIISYVSDKIKQSSENNGNNRRQMYFKNLFANIAVITAFIVSVLTIVLNILDIILKHTEIISK